MSNTSSTSATTKARNNLRPFFRSRKPQPFWKQLQSVRQETAPEDYAAVCPIVESNPAYPFPGFGNTFPTSELFVPNNRFSRMRPLTLVREVALQVTRLNY